MARAVGYRLLIAAIVAFVVGCLTPDPLPKSAWFDRFRAGGPQGSDVIVMQIALIEQPIGDRYLDDDLWNDTDGQAVALDHKAVLEDNGFRVGTLGGITPVKFQELITSDRSCVNPHENKLHAGAPKTIHLGAPIHTCKFEVRQSGKSTPVSFDQAQCILQVTPTITPDGRVKLSFMPQVQHGPKSIWAAPSDGSAWALQGQRPTEKYSSLGWDVTISAQEYVVVGTRNAKAQTLGWCCFARPDEDRPVQRVLAIRARAVAPASDLSISAAGARAAPPLAARASQTTVRGSRD